MASGVSTINLPGVQRAPDAPLIPDEKLDRILEKAKSQLEENEVRELAKVLSKVSEEHPLPIYRRIQPAGNRRCSPISQ